MRRRLWAASILGVLGGCVAAEPASPLPSEGEQTRPIPPGQSIREILVTPQGEATRMRLALFRPVHDGPHPLLVFHHGSTGRGENPASFPRLWTPTEAAELFARNGWLVAVPQRRGRGGSSGRYDEGFGFDRRGYSNEPSVARAGYERAMADAMAATDWLHGRTEVDSGRWMLGGQSRGGILAVGQAARQPQPGLLGVLNFVGGWLGESYDQYGLNAALFAEAGRGQAPALFLYADQDPFYGLAFSRRNFEAFAAAGGRGRMETFETAAPGTGHALISRPDQWQSTVSMFLREVAGRGWTA